MTHFKITVNAQWRMISFIFGCIFEREKERLMYMCMCVYMCIMCRLHSINPNIWIEIVTIENVFLHCMTGRTLQLSSSQSCEVLYGGPPPSSCLEGESGWGGSLRVSNVCFASIIHLATIKTPKPNHWDLQLIMETYGKVGGTCVLLW